MSKKLLILTTLLLAMSLAAAETSKLEMEWHYDIDEQIDSLYIEDINNDGFQEIIIEAKNPNIRLPDRIYVLDRNGLLLWFYELHDLQALCVSDVNNDHFKEIIFSQGNIQGGIARGGIYLLNREGDIFIQFPQGKLKSNVLMRNIEAIDLDENKYKEIMGNTHNAIYVLKDSYDDFLMNIVLERKIEGTDRVDLNRDGYMDVLARSIYRIYDVSLEGMVRWNYTLEEEIKTTVIADIYSQGNYEVVLISKNDTIYILDDSGILEFKDKKKEGINNAIGADFDDDGFDELVLGTGDGLYFWDIVSSTAYEYRTNNAVKAISSAVLEENGEMMIFASEGNQIHIISGNGFPLKEYEVKQEITEIYLEDLDKDGFRELITSSDRTVSVYQLKDVDVLASTTSTSSTTSTISTTSTTTSTTETKKSTRKGTTTSTRRGTAGVHGGVAGTSDASTEKTKSGDYKTIVIIVGISIAIAIAGAFFILGRGKTKEEY